MVNKILYRENLAVVTDTYLDGPQFGNCRMWHDDLLEYSANQKLLVVFPGHREGLVERRCLTNESDLKLAVTSGRPLAPTVVELDLILVSAEGLLFAGQQIESTAGARSIAVITHIAAWTIATVCATGKAIALEKTFVTVVARERGKSTLWTHRIREQLISPTMIAQ